jgi:hypothetical protein
MLLDPLFDGELRFSSAPRAADSDWAISSSRSGIPGDYFFL